MTQQFKPLMNFRSSSSPENQTVAAVQSRLSELLEAGQAQERRRITRELHDSTMQLLSCVGLSLARLRLPDGNAHMLEIIAEIENLVSEAQSELRTLSYLAHPPAVEFLGLHDALAALVEGLSRRTGLHVVLHWKGEVLLARPSVESALYRVVQEALSNVHRHAHAANVLVVVVNGRDATEIKVLDDGVGIALRPNHGVGLSSMRDRVGELGGRLLVRSMSPGTEVSAIVPTRAPELVMTSSGHAKLCELSSKCGRTASETADESIAAALRGMASEFGTMADWMKAGAAA